MGADRSTPPALIQIPDGRLVLTFGDRRARDGKDHPVTDTAFWGPGAGYGVSAYLSSDGGATWTPDANKFELRTDGATIDLGYTRNILRSDGRLVTAYWINTDYTDDRHIDATIWDPVAAFDDPPIKADTTPPTVGVVAPAEGATVKGTLAISVSADDDVGVTEVVLYVDEDTAPRASDASTPYRFDLDTKTLADGVHPLRVVARDAAGNSTAASRSFTVANAVTSLKPKPPYNFHKTTVTATQVGLAWYSDALATGFLVQRAPANGGTFATVVTTTTKAATDQGVKAGTTYRYRVLAANVIGVLSSPSATITVKVPAQRR